MRSFNNLFLLLVVLLLVSVMPIAGSAQTKSDGLRPVERHEVSRDAYKAVTDRLPDSLSVNLVGGKRVLPNGDTTVILLTFTVSVTDKCDLALWQDISNQYVFMTTLEHNCNLEWCDGRMGVVHPDGSIVDELLQVAPCTDRDQNTLDWYRAYVNALYQFISYQFFVTGGDHGSVQERWGTLTWKTKPS